MRRNPQSHQEDAGLIQLATAMLIGSVCFLLSLGMVMLYSSKMGSRGEQFLIQQMAWCVVGLCSCCVAARIKLDWIEKSAWILYLIAIVLLVLVLVPGIGHKVYGAQRWLSIKKVVNFQPSEFAKIALIVVLAWYGDRYQRSMPQFFRGLVLPGCIIAAILALIFPEPDWGATLLLAAVSFTVLLLSGTRFLFFVPFLAAGCVSFYYLILNNPVRLARVMAWMDLETHKNGKGYQTYQSLIALGSGGWFGLGLGNGRQKLGYVPEHHTDFILSVIGEELGLIATLAVLIAFLIIAYSGFYIASKSKTQFGFLLGSGVTFLISFQAFINVGVVTGVLPNKGLPLPFISYGGSNLLMMFICLGLLLNIARETCAVASHKSQYMPAASLVSSTY